MKRKLLVRMVLIVLYSHQPENYVFKLKLNLRNYLSCFIMLYVALLQEEKTLKKKWKENSPEIMEEWKSRLQIINPFTAEEIEREFKLFLEKNNF